MKRKLLQALLQLWCNCNCSVSSSALFFVLEKNNSWEALREHTWGFSSMNATVLPVNCTMKPLYNALKIYQGTSWKLECQLLKKKQNWAVHQFRQVLVLSCVHQLSTFEDWLMLLQLINTSPFWVLTEASKSCITSPLLIPKCRWPGIPGTILLSVFENTLGKDFVFQTILQTNKSSDILQVKGHIQSYEPYLKGIFTCFSFSSNAFSSSDARTIPLSVWFSCKSVGNALNGKGLKTPKYV